MQFREVQFDASAQKLVEQLGELNTRAQSLLIGKAKQTGAPLSVQQIQGLLLAAMPEKLPEIAQQGAMNHQCDGKRGDFLTQLIRLHIEKEVDVIYRQPQTPTITRRDPMKGRILFDKDASYVAICNGADVADGGVARVLKVIKREGAGEVGCLDLKGSRLEWRHRDDAKDIQVVANNALAVDFEDVNEEQFQNGDGTFFVSFDAKGKEIPDSRDGTMNPEGTVFINECHADREGRPDPNRRVRQRRLDNADTDAPNLNLDGAMVRIGRHVRTHDHKVQLYMFAKDNFPAGSWTGALGQHVEMSLVAENGLHYELGSKVNISYLRTVLNTTVDPEKDKWQMLGNAPAASAVDLGRYAGHSLQSLLDQNVIMISSTKPQDQRSVTRTAKELIYGLAAQHVKVGNAAFQPVGDSVVAKGQLEGMGIRAHFDECGKNQLAATLRLGKGFVSADDPASVEGWRIDVGYRDHQGQWHGCESQYVKSPKGSSDMELRLPAIEDAKALFQANGKLEIQVYNDKGIPAQRIQIPVDQIDYR